MGRIRKCSIVQEEEDDEDDAEAEEEMSLNRRGSRSEGRINISLQDRITETERLKKEATNAPSEPSSIPVESSKSLLSGLGGVTLISSNTDPKEKLGLVRGAANVTKRPMVIVGTAGSVPRANSVDNAGSEVDHSDLFSSTKFLTDSKTITIPLTGSQPYVPAPIPKYKTMPSPARLENILPDATTSLNEIFEENTDIGSSDSATTTPRSITKHAHYVSNRAQSQGPSTATSSSARRSKFHKTRTASCSSSDASDDDSENRKKRAHKIVDSTKPSQRRDSYDDSSDSQDPGTGTSASSSSLLYPIQMVVGDYSDEQHKSKERNGGGNSNSNGRQKTGQQMGFRRHRAGRRRAGETRLRESQSLNRITEVQESEPSTSSLSSQQSNKTSDQHTPPSNASPNVNIAMNNASSGAASHPKPRGFSARLFHGFRKTDSGSVSPSSSRMELPGDGELRPPPARVEDGNVEMVLGVELAKALKVTESKGNTATKKLKMLGRYFQVFKHAQFYSNDVLLIYWMRYIILYDHTRLISC